MPATRRWQIQVAGRLGEAHPRLVFLARRDADALQVDLIVFDAQPGNGHGFLFFSEE